jgi:aminodeoxychorismate synthase component I
MSSIMLPRFVETRRLRVVLQRPLADYVAAFDQKAPVALLDSALRGRRARFSFLATGLRFSLEAYVLPESDAESVSRARLVFRDHAAPEVTSRRASVEWLGDPFDAVEAVLQKLRPAWEAAEAGAHGAPTGMMGTARTLRDAPPFVSGAVGFLGYELAKCIERLPTLPAQGATDLWLGWFNQVLAHDHETGETTLFTTVYGDDRGQLAARAEHEQAGVMAALANVHADVSSDRVGRAVAPWKHVEERMYHACVTAAVGHIERGDIFQVCLTQRIDAPFEGDPWTAYCRLRAVNPAPHAAFLRTPYGAVLSASPERFLAVAADGRVESCPIKGTRRRGRDPADDAVERNELATSEKDRAENTMIVDLVRSDLGRVCAYGSVQVPQYGVVETYPAVFQLVSTVCGRLRPGAGLAALLRATFPGGSMTGAPKIEAMKIAATLEASPRGIYAGALGYFDVRGAVDLAMVIRTAVIARGRVTVGTGGAITADSTPSAEHEEMRLKARAVVQALEDAQREGVQREGVQSEASQGDAERCT